MVNVSNRPGRGGLAAWSAAIILLGATGGAQAAVPPTSGAAGTWHFSRNAAGFVAALAPDGAWVAVPGVGSVWRPSPDEVGAGFAPYVTGGRWVRTRFGPQFASRWWWGTITFHYGRWFRDADYGWVWAPGPVWGPAWVAWRRVGDYVGWSPIAPGQRLSGAPESWVFVPQQDLSARDLPRHVLSPLQAARVILQGAKSARAKR